MDIYVTRSRLSGTARLFEYRALLAWDALADSRRELIPSVRGPKIAGGPRCARIAPVIAPARYFTMAEPDRSRLAVRIGRVARRVETLLVRSVFPEMTEDCLPIHFRAEQDFGDQCHCVTTIDLLDSFDRLEPEFDVLTAYDLGLRQGDARCAA